MRKNKDPFFTDTGHLHDTGIAHDRFDIDSGFIKFNAIITGRVHELIMRLHECQHQPARVPG